jgi:hypothetical protein
VVNPTNASTSSFVIASIIYAHEFNFVHQTPNEFQAPAATALAIAIGLAVLGQHVSRDDATTGNGNHQFVTLNAKPLIDFAVGTEAVFGGVDARLDQREFDLIDRLRPKLIRRAICSTCVRRSTQYPCPSE